MAAVAGTATSAVTAAILSCFPPAFVQIPRRLLPFSPFPHIASWQRSKGFCTVVASACRLRDADGELLLRGIADKSVVDDLKHIMEMAGRALTKREIITTDFLNPLVLNEAIFRLEKLADCKVVSQGGYPQAERCRLSLGHSDIMADIPDTVAALRITGNFGFESCSHGDFLGAILGTGIVREKVGDILLQGEKGAQVLVVPELVGFLTSALNKVGNVTVSISEIPLLAIEYEEPRTKSFRTVESSLRVDAIVSAGFKMSRTKLVNLISDGYVRVNWSMVTKNGATLKTGDVVSVSGKGRLKIGEIVTTRKGKYVVELIRYI